MQQAACVRAAVDPFIKRQTEWSLLDCVTVEWLFRWWVSVAVDLSGGAQI